MDHAGVVLRAAHVARVLERHPRMARLEEHLEHPLPELERAQRLAVELARGHAALVLVVAAPRTRAVRSRAGPARRSSGTASSSSRASTRCMNRSGIQFAVFMSCVRRRSSPVFRRRSRKSPMSLCQSSRYAQPDPARLPPWLTATSWSLCSFRNGTTPWRLAVRAARCARPVPRTAVHEPPRPPAHFEHIAFSAMPRCRRSMDSVSVDLVQVAARELRMRRAGVEQRRRRRAEPALAVEPVQIQRAGIAVGFRLRRGRPPSPRAARTAAAPRCRRGSAPVLSTIR